MRLIKLSKKEFNKEEDVDHFFGPDLKSNRSLLEQREPPGAFFFGEKKIGEGGIQEGETLLFTYDGKLRFIAKSASGRLTMPGKERFPNYFVIDLASLRQSKPLSLEDLENLFETERKDKSFKGRAWVTIPETTANLDTVSKLMVESLEDITARDIEAEEIEQGLYAEGKQKTALVNKYERDKKVRAEAIRIQGLKCLACGFSFEDFYGKHGENYIQVHHLRSIASYGGEVQVSPEKDLAVVCSNCHSMIHRSPKTPLTIEDLRRIIEEARKRRG